MQVNPFLAALGFLGGGGGMDFDSEVAYRDVFYQGKCDDGCLELAKQLGWEVRGVVGGWEGVCGISEVYVAN